MIFRLRNSLKRKFRKIVPFLMASVGVGLAKITLATCRFKIEGLEKFVANAESERCIIMLWHNRLAILAYFLYRFFPQYNYAAFISKSRDGDMIASVADSYPQGRSIRVAHNAKYNALREMIKQLKENKEIMLMTPDGPRGPKYRVKPGIVLAAQNSQSKIIPLTWSASRFWQLKSWDNLILPKPFSRIVVSIGDSIELGDSDTEECIAESMRKLQKRLNFLTLQACHEVDHNKANWPI